MTMKSAKELVADLEWDLMQYWKAKTGVESQGYDGENAIKLAFVKKVQADAAADMRERAANACKKLAEVYERGQHWLACSAAADCEAVIGELPLEEP